MLLQLAACVFLGAVAHPLCGAGQLARLTGDQLERVAQPLLHARQGGQQATGFVLVTDRHRATEVSLGNALVLRIDHLYGW